jgi:transglutaminase-like putative cysteine protease
MASTTRGLNISGTRQAPPVPRAIDRFFQFSLLGMLASGYFALLGTNFLDLPSAALTLAALVARGLIVAQVIKFDPPPRAVAALTVAYIGFFPLDYLYLSSSIFTAVIHLILFLAIIKVVTAKTQRDYGYLKIIAGLELLAAATLSFQLNFFLFLILFLISTIATYASGEIRNSTIAYAGIAGATGRPRPASVGLRRFSQRLSAFTAYSFLGILTITGGAFFVLPRTARGAFQRFVPKQYHLPGFSNEVTLGEIGEIKQSSRPVMHVQSYSGAGLTNVRWRGSVLSDFDGQRWSNPASNDIWLKVDRGALPLRSTLGRRGGRNIAYQVELNDIASDTLFFAGTPESISINVPMLRFSRGETIRTPPRTITTGLKYGVYSYLDEPNAPLVAPPEPDREAGSIDYLRLPSIDSRIPQLAREMAGEAVSDFDRARAIEKGLRSRYGYTLELLKEPVEDPLAYFLFVRQKGHCEYFASAMAVMLRTMRIPSRVAVGFLSGVYNPMTGWQVVRASDAHSWVEAWIPNQGWVTFDPTPPDPGGSGGGLSGRISLLLDTVDQFWQDWVMGYNLERQVVLATRMGESSRNMQLPHFDSLGAWFKQVFGGNWLHSSAAGLIAFFIAAGAVGAAVWMLFGQFLKRWWRAAAGVRRARRGQGEASDATLLYERMLAQLAKRGIRKPPHVTPQEFALGLTEPAVSGVVQELTAFYNEFRFGNRPAVAPRMIQLLERLEQSH